MTTSATSGDRRRVGRPPGPSPDPAERREAILDAAERVIRAQGPQVGMQDIAAGLGLTKPAVYRSLGDKAALSAALGRRVATRLGERLAATLTGPGELRDVVVAAIDVFCTFVDEDPHLYRFIVHGSKGTESTAFRDRPLVARLGREISSALAVFLDRSGGDPALADTWAYAIIGAVFSATEHWRHDPQVPRATLVDHLAALITPALETQHLAP